VEVLKRLEQQAGVVRELGSELRQESSYRGLERLVQLTVQSLLDLGLMVLSAAGSSPSGYRDVASSLGRLGLLSHGDAELMRDMAGLRNILVHAYVGVDREIVLGSSRRLPDDAVRLADEILRSAKRVVDDPEVALDELTETLRGVLKDRVKVAFLFGSRVKGYSLKGDVDIALFFGRRPDPYEVGGLLCDVQESLGREDVHILVLDDCDNISLAYEALRGKPILGDKGEILQLRARTASQYLDYQVYLQKAKVRSGCV